MKNFNSVSTTAVRVQDISPNPQKLAGQCAKLKCCLNYEVDTYIEASQQLPDRRIELETADGIFYFFKADILAGLVTYSSDKRLAANLTVISAERAKEVMEMNKRGEKPLQLSEETDNEPKRSVDLLEQESLTRFDRSRNKRRGGRNKSTGERPNNGGEARQADNRPDNAPNKRAAEGSNRPADNANRPAEAANADRRSEQRRNNRPRPDRRNNRPRGPQNRNNQAADNNAPQA